MMISSPVQFGSLDKLRQIAGGLAADKAAKAERAFYDDVKPDAEATYLARQAEIDAVLETEFLKTPFGNMSGRDLLQAVYDRQKETGRSIDASFFLKDLQDEEAQGAARTGLRTLKKTGLLTDFDGYGADYKPSSLGKFILLKPKFSVEA